MSFVNMILYGAVLPSYGGGRRESAGKAGNETIDADDPRNRERVRELLFNER